MNKEQSIKSSLHYKTVVSGMGESRNLYTDILDMIENAGFVHRGSIQTLDEEKVLDFAEEYLGEARNDACIDTINVYELCKAICSTFKAPEQTLDEEKIIKWHNQKMYSSDEIADFNNPEWLAKAICQEFAKEKGNEMTVNQLIQELQTQSDMGYGDKPIYCEDGQTILEINSVQKDTMPAVEPNYLFIMGGDRADVPNNE